MVTNSKKSYPSIISRIFILLTLISLSEPYNLTAAPAAKPDYPKAIANGKATLKVLLGMSDVDAISTLNQKILNQKEIGGVTGPTLVGLMLVGAASDKDQYKKIVYLLAKDDIEKGDVIKSVTAALKKAIPSIYVPISHSLAETKKLLLKQVGPSMRNATPVERQAPQESIAEEEELEQLSQAAKGYQSSGYPSANDGYLQRSKVEEGDYHHQGGEGYGAVNSAYEGSNNGYGGYQEYAVGTPSSY